jgi:hypothetical protein
MTKESNYLEVKKAAQALADETGFDVGIELNPDFMYYRSFLLPRKEHRCGFELYCEVVHCTDLTKCQVGHGP